MEIIWFFILISFLLVYVAVVGAMIVRLVSRDGEGPFSRKENSPAEEPAALRG